MAEAGKWTPGKWRIDPKYPADIQAESGRIEVAVVAQPSDHAAGRLSKRRRVPPVQQARANARLIAAAPDLYEALADLIENKCSEHCDWEAARTALARAQGRTEGNDV